MSSALQGFDPTTCRRRMSQDLIGKGVDTIHGPRGPALLRLVAVRGSCAAELAALEPARAGAIRRPALLLCL